MAFSNLPFTGSFGNFSFYKRNGKYVSRMKGGGSKTTIKNNPSCAGTRSGNIEFGGASQIGALIRRAIGPQLKQFSDVNMISNFTGVLRTIVKQGSGIPGARMLDIAVHAEVLEGFEFNADCSFVSRFKKKIAITFSEDRNTALLQTTFCPATDIVAPAEATSFQLVYTFMRVPSYGLNATTKRYQPLHDVELVSAQVSSALLYTDLDLPVKLNLSLTLPASAAEGTTLLCIAGIAFYNEQGLMGRGVNGMKVVQVG